jgi:multicomponent Na+:H+ antiporter subunit G
MITVSIVLTILGLIFFTGGVVGLIRFPDFYSRLHPAGKMDTLGSILVLAGLGLYQLHDLHLSSVLTTLKLLFILGFIFLVNPTATHAIVDAGFRAGMRPWRKGQERN